MKIAEELKKTGLIPLFQNENISIETILKLTEGNVIELRVTKLGDRILLKEKCWKLRKKGKNINGSTYYDTGDGDNNANTIANERSQFFRVYTSVHARRRSSARGVHFRSSIRSFRVDGRTEKVLNAKFVCLALSYL